MSNRDSPMTDITVFLLALGMVAIPLAGWITNILWTFQQREVVPVALGIFGALVAPIGAIHGIALWF